MSTVIRLLVYCRADCYPHGLFDSVLNMCCFCFVFRSRHSLCERYLSVVPIDTNCCVLLGFVLRSGLRYALHPSHLPKLGCCRSAPVTWPCWFNIKAMSCLIHCRVPFMSTLFCRPFIANVGRVKFLLQCCPNRPLVSWQRRWRANRWNCRGTRVMLTRSSRTRSSTSRNTCQTLRS